MASTERDAEPLLSVVIPTHDVAPWLSETLRSVLAQDIDEMEVIIVDDHSADGTVEIAQRFAEVDERVTVVRAEETGGGSARNLGARRASGRYLIFCDGDDVVPDGAYAALVSSLETSASDMAIGDFLKFSPTDTWSPTANMAAYQQPGRRRTLSDSPTLILARPCWNRAFRRTFWNESRLSFPDVPRSNDIVPMIAALTRADSIDVIPDVVYLYRERPGGSSMTARAVTREATISYLTQELECARMIAEFASDDVSGSYLRLIWDRDGFAHVSKFVLAAENRTAASAPVAETLGRLLRSAGDPPSDVSPVKRLTLLLASSGEWDAAAIMAAWELGRPLGVSALAGWAIVMKAIDRQGLRAHLDPHVVWLVRRQLQSVLGAEDDAAAWSELAETFAAVVGAEELQTISEVRTADLPLGAVPELRDTLDGRVFEVHGGPRLKVSGTSAHPDDRVAPVLWPVDDLAEPILAGKTSWRLADGEDNDAVWQWTAEFPRRALTVGRKYQPALQTIDAGPIVGVRCVADLPVYSAFDAFIFAHEGETLIVHRRENVVWRAVRRAYLIAGNRLHLRATRAG